MADKTLDAKGMNCPIPILKAKKAIVEVPVGGTLEILATDPGAVADFQAFARQTGELGDGIAGAAIARQNDRCKLRFNIRVFWHYAKVFS